MSNLFSDLYYNKRQFSYDVVVTLFPLVIRTSSAWLSNYSNSLRQEYGIGNSGLSAQYVITLCCFLRYIIPWG